MIIDRSKTPARTTNIEWTHQTDNIIVADIEGVDGDPGV